mgnify:CR=1 FL=1
MHTPADHVPDRARAEVVSPAHPGRTRDFFRYVALVPAALSRIRYAARVPDAPRRGRPGALD